MRQEYPIQGSFYRHFKGNLYQVQAVATHSETGEKLVVYQALYPPYGIWVRPLDMFLAPVDHQKYPQVTQEWRFEKIEHIEEMTVTSHSDSSVPKVGQTSCYDGLQKEEQSLSVDVQTEVSEEELRHAILSGQAKEKLSGRMEPAQIGQAGMMLLLDAETNKEKRELLIGLHDFVNQRLLNNIAVALDVSLEDGDEEQQYEALVHCLQTFERYEGRRLR